MYLPEFNKNYLEYYSRQLLESLLDDRGMEDLVELASKLTGNPVAVGNARLTVLYTSKNMPANVPMAKPGVISPDFSTDKEFIKYNEAAYYSNKPIVTDEQYGGYKTLLTKLSLHGKVVGYMSILFYNRLYQPDIEPLAILIRETIECALTRHSSLLATPPAAPESLFADILNHKTDAISSNADAVIRLGINKQTDFYILAFSMIGFSKANMPGADIKNQLLLLTGSGLSTYDNENIVLLKQGSIKNLMTDSGEKKTLLSYMHKNGLCGGISFSCRQISDIPGGYRQAKLALSCAKHRASAALIPYDYVVFPDFVKNTIVKHCMYYKLPEIKRLENYDNTHSTNYRHVLKTYVENGKNAGLTAAQTGLSKSSVYRILDRIRLMTGIDFEQNDHLFSVYLGLKIDDCLSSGHR